MNSTTTEQAAPAREVLPVTVTACILPGKQDPSATAQFANLGRAEQYAGLLKESRDYPIVRIHEGDDAWEVR